MATIASPEHAKDNNFLACLLVIVLALPGFYVLAQFTCGAKLREPMAESLLSQLSQAANAYELDFAAYPPGDGEGSAALVRALNGSRNRKQPYAYFQFSPDMIPDGEIQNPVRDGAVVHYRSPGLHNPRGFDLWCEDAKGRADGINNWGR